MAIHFLTSTSIVACGKNNVGEVSDKSGEVTCKNCLRSQAYTQREAVAGKTPVSTAPSVTAPVAAKVELSIVKTGNKPEPKAKVVAKTSTQSVAFAEWRQRFGANDRLPRGKAFASM